MVGSGKAKALQGEADRLPCCDETSQRNANLSLKKSESSGQGLRQEFGVTLGPAPVSAHPLPTTINPSVSNSLSAKQLPDTTLEI